MQGLMFKGGGGGGGLLLCDFWQKFVGNLWEI